MKPKVNSLPRGFALVATLLLMILLAIIVVGMLSLSAVSLRSTSQQEAQDMARANARMALMVAIGELQKNAGLDTRVTAPADMLDETNPPLTGVWKSWEGSDHESSGRPIQPDYSSKNNPTASGGYFLTWLVSGSQTGSDPKSLVSKTPIESSIPLLSSGSLTENDDRQVHVVPTEIKKDESTIARGAYAWWVSPENQKSRLPEPYKPEPDNAAKWSDIVKSHSVIDPEVLGLNQDDPDYLSKAQKAFSLATVEFIPGGDSEVKPHQNFHDLSTSSVGLLTNTATGGWRKDLSLLTEYWNNTSVVPNENLPLFRLDPVGYSSESDKPTTANPRDQNAQHILYPWGAHINWYMPQQGAVASWKNLVDYATEYKRINYTAGGYPSLRFSNANATSIDVTSNQGLYAHLHNSSRPSTTSATSNEGGIHTIPIVSRIQWVMSHRTVRQGTPPDYTYRVEMLVTPVVTFWNPNNFRITNLPDGRLDVSIPRTIPFAFRYYDSNGASLPVYRTLSGGGGSVAAESYTPIYNAGMEYQFTNASFTPSYLDPGETRVFSPTASVTNFSPLVLSPGLRLNQGHRLAMSTVLGFTLGGEDEVKMDMRFDAPFTEASTGITPTGRAGIYMDLNSRTASGGNPKGIITARMHYPLPRAREYWPALLADDQDSTYLTAAELVDPTSPTAPTPTSGWQPFFTTIYGLRSASSSLIPTKGFAQSSPLVLTYRSVSGGDGIDHPIHAAYDFSYIRYPSGNSDHNPNVTPTNNGFILTGTTSARGLSKAVIGALPLRPIASLGELQNWNLRGQNLLPPYKLNIIGNSDASPNISKDKAVHVVAGITDSQVRQHDDSYCANHVLFDDWFLSSIAPEPGSFGNTPLSRTINKTYQELLIGKSPLVNYAYKPISEDQFNPANASSAAAADAFALDKLLKTNSWQTIASRLEVVGMFNVNSTSVSAWRALLGHARNQKVPYMNNTSISNLSPAVDYPVSRFPIAGDTKAGQQGISGTFDRSSSFTGYQVFTDEMLDDLAEKIVAQVRLRGPFLSLSEFVNRQLSSDTTLSLAGAIQTSLNQLLSEGKLNEIYKDLIDPEFSKATLPANDPRLAQAGYLFAEAATGKSTFGLPGWIRQADILTPIAPILSARDDTFTIRAYGDSRDKNGKIIARVWCEATVQRSRDYVDPADQPDLSNQADPAASQPTSMVNQIFGRRFRLVSFRWLAPSEI